MDGEIGIGDDEKLVALTQGDVQDIVVMNSPGGRMAEALLIGEIIHARHYATIVMDGSECASGCAFAWLAGDPRMMALTGHVGFHAVYNDDRQPSGPGNAMLGAYLGALGMSLV